MRGIMIVLRVRFSGAAAVVSVIVREPRGAGESGGEGAAMEGLRQGVRIHGAGDLREAGAEVLKAGRRLPADAGSGSIIGCMAGSRPSTAMATARSTGSPSGPARAAAARAGPGPACPGVPVACPVRRARHVLAVPRLGEARPRADLRFADIVGAGRHAPGERPGHDADVRFLPAACGKAREAAASGIAIVGQHDRPRNDEGRNP